MAARLVVVQRGLRDRKGDQLPPGSALTLEDVAGWPGLAAQVEHGALRLEVDGEPLDRLLAAAAMRAKSKPGPVKVGELPRAGQPHWLDKAAQDVKEGDKPTTAAEARSMAAGLAGPILDHGDDVPAGANLTPEERQALKAKFEPQLDHKDDDHSLGTDDDKMKRDAEKNKNRPGAKVKGDLRSDAKIEQASQAAGLAGPILDHDKDPGTLEERAKDADLAVNAQMGDRYNAKTGKIDKMNAEQRAKQQAIADQAEARRGKTQQDRRNDDPSAVPEGQRFGTPGPVKKG